MLYIYSSNNSSVKMFLKKDMLANILMKVASVSSECDYKQSGEGEAWKKADRHATSSLSPDSHKSHDHKRSLSRRRKQRSF